MIVHIKSTRDGDECGFALIGFVILASLWKYPFFEYGSRYANEIFFFQAEGGIRFSTVAGVQTCALPISIDNIGKLENRRDPKCYATASRLEDFVCGTHLSEEARFAKIALQKELILNLWKSADAAGRKAERKTTCRERV